MMVEWEITDSNHSAFEIAISSGYSKIANLLIECPEFDINLSGHNPLRLAIDLGFIDIAHQGGAFDKDKSLYSLVDDFRGWRPGDPPIRTRPKDVVRRGYQGENKNNVR